MAIKEEAVKLHKSGFNCAQSVVCSCGEYTGLDSKTSLAVSGGFGGGVRCGEVCGAVSGGIMAISMAFPYADSTDLAAKDKIAALTCEFTSRFKEKFGCLRCADLKKPETDCNEFIAFAAALAEEIIKNNQ